MEAKDNSFSLEILTKIDQFYTNSFDRLLTYISWGAAVVVVIVPILYALYQKRLAKLESREIEENLKKKIEDIEKKFDEKLEYEIKEISLKFDEKESKRTAKIENNKHEFEKKILKLEGEISSLKADISKDIQYSIFWNCHAAIEFLESENHASLSIQLSLLERRLKANVINNETTVTSLKLLNDKLREYSKKMNGIYFSQSNLIEKKLKEIR